MADQANREDIVHGLMQDIVGDEESIQVDVTTIQDTIKGIMKDYNLSTDLGFVEKIATMKIEGEPQGYDFNDIPKELKDAAFLPVTTITDIALKQDIDLMVSQIPEWFTALTVTRDAICECDVASGKISRSINFDKSLLSENEDEHILSTIEEVEERLDLHSIIKNHIVFNTLEYGEGPIYCIPYAKVFEDLYKYKMNSRNETKTSVSSMFSNSADGFTSTAYGYNESVEISLKDAIIQESATDKQDKNSHIFTEAEIMELYPRYHEREPEKKIEAKNEQTEYDKYIEEQIDAIAENIHFVRGDIALPVIEESALDLQMVYDVKYSDVYDTKAEDFFNHVMEAGDDELMSVGNNFKNVKGVYLKILYGTKLIPIRVDRNIIGYYYISDLTRPEEAGQRKNSGLGGYSLRTPSAGYDTFSPDRMFCDKLANKIINGFNLKFMKDNTALHSQIVSILEAHRFNESMLRFVYIPAEHVVNCAINKDGNGKGHSMLESGLVTARMYMFLKLYSILYQVNNSEVRVYNLRMSGLNKNYKELVNNAIRKFSTRRITVNDIFNYKSSISKVSGQSEMIMPMGTGDKAPLSFDTIPMANSPINTELLENLKNECINSTPVPAAMVQGAMSELDFAKEVELSNTRFFSFVASTKIDLNKYITMLYRKILRYETDIDVSIIKKLKYVFSEAKKKEAEITNDMLSNFQSLSETLMPIMMSKEELTSEQEGENNTVYAREFKKLLLAKFIPQLDIAELEDMADMARHEANKSKLNEIQKTDAIVDDSLEDDMGDMGM